MIHNIYIDIDSSGGNVMPVFNLQVAPDYLLKYAKTQPNEAIKELVWNALDADATEVIVDFERNITGGIEGICVRDNGHGIHYNKIERAFGQLGNSEKLEKGRTPNGRDYHGRRGEGRYKALCLGGQFVWDSCYKDDKNNHSSFLIKCYAKKPHEIDYTEPDVKNKGTPSGVCVYVNEIPPKISDSINNDEALANDFTVEFAPYLIAYPSIRIIVNELDINPEEHIEDQIISEFTFFLEKRTVKVLMRLILWKGGSNNRLHMCSPEGVSLWSGPLQVNHGNLPISVYVQSDYVRELMDQDLLDYEDSAPGLAEIRSKAREMVRNYYKEWLKMSAIKTIEKFRQDGIYPYSDSPKDVMEKAERQVFDICALTMQRQLPEFPKAPKKQKKLMLNLVKEALRQRPSELHRIFQEVLELTDEQIHEFSDILNKTTLNAMISATTMVSDRLRFLNGLDQIIYKPEYLKKLKERSQLHKILLQELWIFGDQYTYGCDDIKLYNVLKEYVKHMGREELAQDLSNEEIEQLQDIPDLCLWSQYNLGRPDEVENLVVELKRPLVKIGEKEMNQIKSYARQVATHPRFPHDKTRWTFLLVSGELNDQAKWEMKDKKDSCYLQTDNVSVYIKDWGQIINEANARHRYLGDSLELAVANNKEGLSYLSQKYSEFLPKTVLESPVLKE